MTSLTILIVDDVALNRKLLQAQLETEGHVVVSASNGVEALEVLGREGIDVVISDILMPGMDGYRLCHEVRRNDRLNGIPFIFHTATYTSPADEKLSLDLGADSFLHKPASTQELLEAIARATAGTRREPTASLAGMDVLHEYSERLVSKLEERNIALTTAASQLSLQMAALETAADAVLITDQNGMILWVNESFTTTTGFTRQEAVGRSPRILKSGKHGPAFYREFWDTITSGQVWRGEFTNRHKDGRLYYGQHTISPIRGTDGSITHFVGVLHDITERRRAEQELNETHQQLRQLLEHSPAVIYALAVEGETITPTLASENITRLLGFSVPEALSLEWWLEKLHPEDRELALASVTETLNGGVSRTEYRLQHKDGSYRWVEDNRRLVRDDAGGKPRELVGVWTDITERRRAQDELRVSERRFSDMLNHLHLISMMLDRNARITYCNDYFLGLTGWEREELLGRSWFDVFMPPELVGEWKGVLAALIADLPEASHHENEILTRSGGRRLIRWNNSALHSGSGEVIGTASIGEDVTDRKALEDQLLRNQRLESLGTLAGGIAHDLNNLFMPILMGATLIKRLEPSARARKAIENIELCVKRGTDLVKQVLLFARGVEGSQTAVNIGSIIAEVESIAASTFPRNVRLVTNVTRSLPLLTGDPTLLTQVLLNLCLNARDGLPGGGEIRVSAGVIEIDEQSAVVHGGTGAARYVVLEVADNGTGMAQTVVDRIFEPFFTTKPIGKGTGLGLSTAQGIVRSHGGFITVASEVGRGSNFKVHLPVRFGAAEGASASREAEQEAPRGNGERILVVDDEEAILDITRQTLEVFGYEVLTAVNGAHAIELYVRHRSSIALVLTDMMMPVIDGATLIAALRRIDPDVRIIAASGMSDILQQGSELDTGTPFFLVKPYSAEHMLRTVFDVLHGGGAPPA